MNTKIFSFSAQYFLDFTLFLLFGILLSILVFQGHAFGDEHTPTPATENQPKPQKESKASPGTKSGDFNEANLRKMGIIIFGGPKNIPQLARIFMSFMGKTILFASVLGFMIGGGFMVFSAGDEGTFSRGKDILKASIIGLCVTLLAFLIVTLVQSLTYSIT